MNRPFPLVVATVAIFLTDGSNASAETPDNATLSPPTNRATDRSTASADKGDERQLIDEAFDIRVQLTAQAKGGAATFRFIERELARSPRPRIKAWKGEYLQYGKAWGAPEGRKAEGVELLREAMAAGDLHATTAMALELFYGGQVERDPVGALKLLIRANDAGYRMARNALGDLMLGGVLFGRADPAQAEHWYRKGAFMGNPYPLYALGQWYESGARDRSPDLAKAVELYLEAAIHGSDNAIKRLGELALQAGASQEILRAHYLVNVWFGALGDIGNRAEKVKAAKLLLLLWPKDPVVLVAMGRIYRGSYVISRDYERAYSAFDQAAKLGSADGRCERAKMLAEGLGVQRDGPRALTELRELEATGHPGALGALGYYHYWGTLKGSGLVKDPVLAFTYSKRAAEGGDFLGQCNTAACYEFGIGTAINYPLAAHYCQVAALRGDTRSRQQLPRIVSEILD